MEKKSHGDKKEKKDKEKKKHHHHHHDKDMEKIIPKDTIIMKLM